MRYMSAKNSGYFARDDSLTTMYIFIRVKQYNKYIMTQ